MGSTESFSICSTTLRKWSKESFAIPMVWKEPLNHYNDYYFCLIDTKGMNSGVNSKFDYVNLLLDLFVILMNALC